MKKGNLMKMSLEEYNQKKIIEDITLKAYIDAGGQVPSSRPAPDQNAQLLPTKSTEGENHPPYSEFHFFNNEAKQQKAEHLQGLLNQLARKD